MKTLEEETFLPSFWENTEKNKKVLNQIKIIKSSISNFLDLESKLENLEILLEILKEEQDQDIFSETMLEIEKFNNALKNYTILSLLNCEYDINNAVLSLNAGSGGTEACDWVTMLLRMYTRFAERHGYDIEILDTTMAEASLVKSVTIEIKGNYAYGYLKGEKGVHRLIRISPFDSSGRRHTSFASCSVLPVFEDNSKIEIEEKDLKIDTYRASGAGGQHVNKTESAIRITHIPTGIVVQCQNERSQHKNKESAMKILKSKIFELENENKKNNLKQIKGNELDISWGSQIRSYVFNPYSLVKDHRTSFETGNTKAVMDGDINGFVNSYLEFNNRKN